LCGVILAVPFGLLPAMLVFRSANGWWPSLPWLVLAELLIGIPLLATAGGWLFARTPRRVDLGRIS
jgi:hypothetical protein